MKFYADLNGMLLANLKDARGRTVVKFRITKEKWLKMYLVPGADKDISIPLCTFVYKWASKNKEYQEGFCSYVLSRLREEYMSNTELTDGFKSILENLCEEFSEEKPKRKKFLKRMKPEYLLEYAQ